MRAAIFAFACLFMIAACSDDDDTSGDGQVLQDQGVVSEQGTGDGQGTGDQGAPLESKGGCDIDAAGKNYCVDYVGTKYEQESALNSSKSTCTSSSGTWVDAGCATDEFQGYCARFEGSSTEHRFYYYNYSTEDLATVKTECEDSTDQTWYDA